MNFVYEKWDENGNPIPNFYYLNKKEGIRIVPDLSFVDDLGFETLEVKNCRIKDINKNEKFYFIISYLDECLFFTKKGKLIFSEEIEYHIIENNLKIVFISPYESPYNLIPFLTLLKNNIIKKNWKEENFYIINNNSMLYLIKEKLNSNMNFFKMDSLFVLETIKNQIEPNENNLIYNKKFIFLSQNRQPHEHRILLLTHLKNLNLLQDDITNWSLLMTYDRHQSANRVYSTINSIQHMNKRYIDASDKKLVSDYVEIINTKKIDYYEENIDQLNLESYKLRENHSSIKSHLESYINIVAETYFSYMPMNVHITEKSIKSFYYFQMPIFLSSYNHVKMLREEYDFYLFDDLIDHSYDNELDDVKRFKIVIDEIKRLSNMREEITSYYKKNIDKILHNHFFVKNHSNNKTDEKYFLKL
jgi:hypothetical protein